VGPRAGLDRCGKSRPTGIRSPDRPARSQSLYRLRNPARLDLVTTTNIYCIVQIVNSRYAEFFFALSEFLPLSPIKYELRGLGFETRHRD
jgi:hypothetical protein